MRISTGRIREWPRGAQFRPEAKAARRPHPAGWVIACWDTEIGGECRLVCGGKEGACADPAAAIRFDMEDEANDWLADQRHKLRVGTRGDRLGYFRPRAIVLEASE